MWQVHELRTSESLYELCWENHKAVSALSFRSQAHHQESCCEVCWKQEERHYWS